MTRFYVWDELNESEKYALPLDACDADSAAVLYAEQDVDGGIDHIYERGHTICVRQEGSAEPVKRFKVEVEYDPSFFASEIEDAP